MDRVFGFLRSLAVYYAPWKRRAWTRFYRDVLDPGDLVFDVGAHVGTRSRAMRLGGARVVAIEPQRLFARFLRRTLPRDIYLVEAAVGAESGDVDMAVSRRHPTVSSLRADFVEQATQTPGFQHVRWDRTERVRVVTLDQLATEYGHPDYVKIDVEGFESEVLAGVTTPPPMVSVEFLPGFAAHIHAAMEQLQTLGDYRFNPVVGESAQFLWSKWRDAEQTKTWLDTLPVDSESGDLFARRKDGRG